MPGSAPVRPSYWFGEGAVSFGPLGEGGVKGRGLEGCEPDVDCQACAMTYHV